MYTMSNVKGEKSVEISSVSSMFSLAGLWFTKPLCQVSFVKPPQCYLQTIVMERRKACRPANPTGNPGM